MKYYFCLHGNIYFQTKLVHITLQLIQYFITILSMYGQTYWYYV